jgi:hypothetical protein
VRTKEAIESQYHASLEMLKQAILHCPDALWESGDYKNPFWHIAYHVLFYTHFYLHPSEGEYVPWEKRVGDYTSLENPHDQGQAVYEKADLLEYLELINRQVSEQIDAMDLQAESGFYWLPFDKLELQLYNIRHITLHTGELCERLGATGDVEIGWVGMGSA